MEKDEIQLEEREVILTGTEFAALKRKDLARSQAREGRRRSHIWLQHVISCPPIASLFRSRIPLRGEGPELALTLLVPSLPSFVPSLWQLPNQPEDARVHGKRAVTVASVAFNVRRGC